mmetsp:Transcript_23503/g.37604  ORF Transcript_23503/g.37604 Transcript_23503/m.37604 type:complete len:688 (-) Transcript_23503:54-2117(-)
MKLVVLVLAFVVPTVALKAVSSLNEDLEVNLLERPVMKVVRLLQDMKVELEKELEDDKAVHEMLSCWCKKNSEEKEAAIAADKAKISQLESSMDEFTAKIAGLKEKRKSTMDEIESDTKALGKATELRFKENKAFHASETDLVEAIDAAKNAIIVLSKHHPELAQLKAVAHQLLDPRISQLLSNSNRIGKASTDYLTHFLQKAETAPSFLSIPGMKSYAPQSGQIFGILKQMKEDFEADLSEETKAEMKAQADYEALKAAKEDEIETGKKLVVDIDASIAENQEKYADAAKELKNTMEELGLDTEFVASLEKKCSESSAEFDARMKDRLAEIEAVTDTIAILNSDESFEAFDKMKAPSFFQVASNDKMRRQRAVSIIQQALARTEFGSGVAELAAVATSAQLDAFTKVKEVIDKVIAQLKVQQAEEVTQRDWCTDELNKNTRMSEAGYDKKDSLTTKIADLEKTIETNKKEIASAKAAIEEMMVQMKKASETREGENADYQLTVTDHHVMEAILKKALERMKEVYAFLQERAPGAPHIQTSGTHTDPGNGPARFTKYDKNAGGGRVVSMIEKIIADVKATVDEAMRTEQDSQSAYESFMKDSNKSIKKTTQSISDMTAAMAQAKEDLSMAKADFKQTMTDLQNLDATGADLHKSCDFLLKNFEVRQKARADEMDALAEAKAVLSGAQ